MSSRKIRLSVVAVVLASSFALLPPLVAQPRAARPAAARALDGAPWERAWGLHFWQLLTSLWGGSGAKIDGNG